MVVDLLMWYYKLKSAVFYFCKLKVYIKYRELNWKFWRNIKRANFVLYVKKSNLYKLWSTILGQFIIAIKGHMVLQKKKKVG